MAISLANVAATYCQYEALQHVSFAAQTLGKCSKLPVSMLWGVALVGARYGGRDALRALGVVAGAALFLGAWRGRASGAPTSLLGAALMLVYLGCDGLTSSLQDRLYRRYGTPVRAQMLRVSGCSAALALGGLLWRGQLGPALAFLARHPACLAAALLLGAVAALGQAFIGATIRAHGAPTLAAALTTRQVLSLLLSSLIFGPALQARQLLALVLLFGAGGSVSRGSLDGRQGVIKSANVARAHSISHQYYCRRAV